jgi:hypothetical protein
MDASKIRLVFLLLIVLAIQACATKGYEDARFSASLRQERLVKIERTGEWINVESNCDEVALQRALVIWSESLRRYSYVYHTSAYRHSGAIQLIFENGTQFSLEVFSSSMYPEDLLFLVAAGGSLISLEGRFDGEIYAGDPISPQKICSNARTQSRNETGLGLGLHSKSRAQ